MRGFEVRIHEYPSSVTQLAWVTGCRALAPGPPAARLVAGLAQRTAPSPREILSSRDGAPSTLSGGTRQHAVALITAARRVRRRRRCPAASSEARRASG